ncbi:MAG: DinB family protein [Acidobacteria bacterium]|nr:DinB family protein [Acidobacteriota bacterium]
MKQAKVFVTVLIVLATTRLFWGQMAPPAPAKTPGEAIDSALNVVERTFTSAADAMPEDKYSFAPTNGEFKGVRTFAQQVKHVAAANYVLGSGILEQKPPVDTGGENGPDALKTKAEIMKFLNDSFAYLHKAVANVSEKNQLDQIASPEGDGKATRLSLATFSVAHPLDHYGQMVEYLRMNAIVPPASRPQNR